MCRHSDVAVADEQLSDSPELIEVCDANSHVEAEAFDPTGPGEFTDGSDGSENEIELADDYDGDGDVFLELPEPNSRMEDTNVDEKSQQVVTISIDESDDEQPNPSSSKPSRPSAPAVVPPEAPAPPVPQPAKSSRRAKSGSDRGGALRMAHDFRGASVSSMWNLSTVWVGNVSFIEREDKSVTWISFQRCLGCFLKCLVFGLVFFMTHGPWPWSLAHSR